MPEWNELRVVLKNRIIAVYGLIQLIRGKNERFKFCDFPIESVNFRVLVSTMISSFFYSGFSPGIQMMTMWSLKILDKLHIFFPFLCSPPEDEKPTSGVKKKWSRQAINNNS